MTYEEHVAEIAQATDAVNLAGQGLMAAQERKDRADDALKAAQMAFRRRMDTDVCSQLTAEYPPPFVTTPRLQGKAASG